MSTFKCKMCGGTLEIQSGSTVAECEYCGAKQTLPKLDDERRANLYDRANHFRRSNEFDKASAIYEQILAEDNTDAEAYWSLVLCRFGIEYVEDPLSHRRVPTVHRAQFTSIFDDDNYKSALKNSDTYQRVIYEEEAKAINEIQKGILAISQKEEPFDVFICYKETDDSGKRTHDSVLAQDLYYQLKQEGFKVFFSRITLADKLGSAYEPYIFAALNSAKVMVVLGTKAEFFNAVWVKNEWSRYLSLIKSGAKKTLIPAYRDMDPYDLPQEFSHLQAQDMSKLGFMQDLIRGIKKILGWYKKPATPVDRIVVQADDHIQSATPLLRRAFLFLEDGEFDNADKYAEKVLDNNPECSEAYVVKLLIELGLKKPSDLAQFEAPISDSHNYQKAIRFASPEYRQTIEGYNNAIIKRIDTARKDEVYAHGVELMKLHRYDEASQYFQKIPTYKDSNQKIDECKRLKETERRDGIYEQAIQLLNAGQFDEAARLFESIEAHKDCKEKIKLCGEKKETARKDAIYSKALMRVSTHYVTDADFKKSIEEFQSISGYRDVDDQIRTLNARLEKWYEDKKKAEEAARVKAEEERRTREREAELRRIKAEKTKKTVKKAAKIGIPSVIALATLLILLFTVVIPLVRYNKADELFDAGKYDEAMEIYQDIGGFSKSEQRITVLTGIKKIDDAYFEEGIKKILSAGVPVKLTYGMGGGDFSGATYLSTPQEENNNGIIFLSASTTSNVTPQAVTTIASVPETTEFTYNSSADFTGIQTPSKSGYRFVKWELEAYSYQIEGPFEMKLNAIWSEKEYTIEYELNDGKVATNNPVEYGIGDDSFTLVNPTKTGYTFIGWTGTDLDDLTMSVTIEKGSVGDRSYEANWQANTYTITLNPNGASIANATIAATYDQAYTLIAPTRTGYTFEGWFNGSTQYTSSIWTELDDVTLVAKWTANTYTVTYNDTLAIRDNIVVTFNYNYSGCIPTTVTLTNGQKLNYPTNPTRDGYVFTGWYTNFSCTTKYDFSGSIAADMTLYAGWSTCTITNNSSYAWSSSGEVLTSTNKNDNSSSTYKITATMPVTISFSYKTSSESGYDYLYIKKNDSILKSCSGETSYVSYSVTLNTDDYLEFIYLKDGGTYHGLDRAYIKDLTYTSDVSSTSTATASCSTVIDCEYADGETASVTVIFDASHTLPALTRTGYCFLGWYNGETKVESGNWNIAANVTLTPRWQGLSNTITLDAAGGTVSANSIAVTYDQIYTLPTPTRTGYTFEGWFNGSTQYTSGIWTEFDDVTLVAKWTANSYTLTYEDTVEINITVTFNYNYSGSASSTVTLSNGQILTYPAVPTRSGYAFAGWYTNSACTTSYEFNSTITEDITLYAKWVSMVSSSSATSREYVDIANYNSNSNKKTFSVTASYSSSPNYYYFTCYKAGTYNFYSAFSSGDYYITVYNATQGTTIINKYNLYSNNSSKSASFTANEGDVIYVSLYKYSSSGSTGSGTFYVSGASYPTSTAKASCSTVTGYAYSNGDNVSTTVTFGSSHTLPVLTRTGYSFLGWYDGETKVESGNWSIAANVTLTPRWQGLSNTITLDAAGGTVSANSIAVTYDQIYTLPTPTRTGYTFEGWFNGSTQYTSGIWTEFDDVTLVAKWTANSYTLTYEDTVEINITVTFNYNYSGSASSTVTLSNGQILTYPAVPTRSGYAFAGWYTNSACTTSYEFNSTITEDITLYAKWESMQSSSYGSEYLNIANYTSSSQQKSITASSYSSYNYYYFTCYKDGTYTIYATWTEGDFKFNVSNVTKQDTIISNYNLYSSQTSTSQSFTASSGDVICVRTTRYSSGYNYTSNGKFYVSDANYPTSTATASCSTAIDYEYADGKTASVAVTFGASHTLPVLTRTGYSFLGWYDGETKVESGNWSIAANVTLTPRWQGLSNTITLDAAGGTVSANSIAVTYDQAYILPTPTRTGYTFEGWFNGSTQYTSGIWTGFDDVTLVAKWTVNTTYTTTYEDTPIVTFNQK